jgi:hypothetical protein
MHRRLTGTEPGLVFYYRLDDGTGSTASDATGHGLTGQLINGPAWVTSTAPIYLPPSVSFFASEPGGRFVLRFDGWAGQPYVVLFSSNLVDWSALGQATQVSPGRFEFIDAGLSNASARFYQLRSQ